MYACARGCARARQFMSYWDEVSGMTFDFSALFFLPVGRAEPFRGGGHFYLALKGIHLC